MKKIFGFTLAEVLITLGVIGVVAAITLPVIISKIQDRQNIVKWKKEFSVVSNAVNSVIADNVQVFGSGGKISKYGGIHFALTDEFVDALREKLNPVDECWGWDVGSEYICWNFGLKDRRTLHPWAYGYANGSVYTTLKNKGMSAYNFEAVSFLLKDGSSVYLGGLHGGPWISVDVNNAAVGPNQIGRDFFQIKVVQDRNSNTVKLLPLGADGSFNKAKNGDFCECSKKTGAETGPYFAGLAGEDVVVSGGCCSAYYLYSK